MTYVMGSGSYLGIDSSDVTSDRAKELKLSSETGVEVTMVDQDSPAGKAGIKEHDVILSFNGQKVDGVEQLRRMIHEVPPGRTVPVVLSREGKQQTVQATLGDRKDLSKSWVMAAPGKRIVIPPIPPIDIEMPDMRSFGYSVLVTPRIGASLEKLTSQLGEYFGAPNSQGLLVTSVEKGGAADTAGLKAGDVITKVQNDRVSDLTDWRSAIRGKTGSVPLTILRDKREQTINVKLPEQRGGVWDGTTIRFDGFDDMADLRTGQLEAQRAMQAASREIERAMREAQRTFENDMRTKQREYEGAQREAQRAIERAQRAHQQAMERTQRDIQRELERQQREQAKPPIE